LGWVGLEPTTFALKGRWQKIANPLIFQRFTGSTKSLYHNCSTGFCGRTPKKREQRPIWALTFRQYYCVLFSAMTQEEQDKRIEEQIQAIGAKYREALNTFEIGKKLVARWGERVPQFKDFVKIEETYRNIIIRKIGRPDEEWDGNWENEQTNLFQIWIEDEEISFHINDADKHDADLNSSAEWIDELGKVIAHRIAWLQRIKGIKI
jgi:hypothetical protein